MKKAERFEEMVRVFSSFPLEKDSFEDFYVDTSSKRSDIDAKKDIINSFRIGLNPYMKVLLTGHRGCGKSTEILSISEKLRDDYEIINFSITEETEIQGLKYVDLIFLIMEQIIEYLGNSSSVNLNSETISDMETYWNQKQFKEMMSYEADDTNVGLGGGMGFLSMISAHFKGVLRSGSESKTLFRQTIEPRLSVLMDMINTSIAEINRQLQEKEQKELLIVIEDMDKLDMAEAKEIFVDHCKSLTGLKIKMLISFPIFMVYTPEFTMIRGDFDKYVLYSMIKVADREGNAYEEGILLMKEIVLRRMQEGLVTDEALRYLIKKSGGAIRDLFEMLSQAAFYAIDKGVNQIDLSIAERMASVLQSDYVRNLSSEEHFEVLKKIYKDPNPTYTSDVLRDLLRTLSVIEYNGDRWLGVHPVLQDFIRKKESFIR